MISGGRGPVDWDERKEELEEEADRHRALVVLRRQRYERFKKYLAKLFKRDASEKSAD